MGVCRPRGRVSLSDLGRDPGAGVGTGRRYGDDAYGKDEEGEPMGPPRYAGQRLGVVGDYYNEKIFADPTPPDHGATRILKGGGFLSDVKNTIYSTHAAGPGDGSTSDSGLSAISLRGGLRPDQVTRIAQIRAVVLDTHTIVVHNRGSRGPRRSRHSMPAP